MVRGSQNRKSQTTHNQRTPQAPVAKKPPTLNNDVPTLTATSLDTRTADYYKLIEDQQKVITSMQEKIHTLGAKVYELEGQINITQTVNSYLQNMVDAQECNDYFILLYYLVPLSVRMRQHEPQAMAFIEVLPVHEVRT